MVHGDNERGIDILTFFVYWIQSLKENGCIDEENQNKGYFFFNFDDGSLRLQSCLSVAAIENIRQSWEKYAYSERKQ